jgi:hypothetical protein
MTDVLTGRRRRNLGHRHAQKQDVKTPKGDGMSTPRREATDDTKPANILILHFQPPKL